jgi:hypothetical protein
MSRIGSIHIEWQQNGEIMWKLDIPDKNPESIFSLGAVALTDHMIATLQSENVISFVEAAINGLLAGKIEFAPIHPELKSARLDLNRGNVLYTTFKANTKLFANNQKVEQGLIQMALNYIGKVLATAAKADTDAIKFGILAVIATYEHNLRIMFDTKQGVAVTRANAAKGVGIFINKYPYGVKAEDLEARLADAKNILAKWKALPLRANHSVFYL